MAYALLIYYFFKITLIRRNFLFFLNFGYVMNCDELTMWRVGNVTSWLVGLPRVPGYPLVIITRVIFCYPTLPV